jgi:hypothetical protein
MHVTLFFLARSILKIATVQYFEKSVTTDQSKRLKIPKDLNLCLLII